MNKQIFSYKFAFIFFGIFYIFGISINNWLDNLYLSLFALLGIVIFFLGLSFYIKKYLTIFLLSILGFTLGIYISDFNLEIINEKLNIVNKYSNQNAKIITEIKSINKITDEKITYIGKVSKIGNDNINVKAEIVINSNKYIEKGTILEFESKIYKYEPFNNFEYEKYMLSKGIYFKVYPYNHETIGQNKVNLIIKYISNLRENLLSKIKEIYTGEEAIFLGGILVGARENMPETLSNNFNNSGLTHMIAVSGFNITILIIFFGYIIKFFPPYIRFIVISIIITLFTILVGFGAPVVRASIMGVIGYFVLISGRKGDIFATIILTLMIMISCSPFSLNYDISLHLSFLAVLGIIYTQPFFEKHLKFMPNIFEIRTAFSLTFSALISTFPIMMFNFGQISLVAPLSNVLVSWTIPIVMLIGFVSLIFYSISPISGMIIGYLARILLRWDILIVNTFGEFKYSIIKYDFGEYKGYLEIIYLLILIFIIMWFKKPKVR